MSDEEPTCIAIDEETEHHIVHRCRCGKTYGATAKARDPGPHIEVLALHVLRLLLANGVVLWGMCRSYAPQPSVSNRVMPNGSSRVCSSRKTASCRRPKTP